MILLFVDVAIRFSSFSLGFACIIIKLPQIKQLFVIKACRFNFGYHRVQRTVAVSYSPSTVVDMM